MTRIRYIKLTDLLVSREKYVINNDLVVVTIDSNLNVKLKQFKGDLQLCQGQGLVHWEGQASNLAHAKRLAKSALSGLGVNFLAEIRKSSLGEIL